MYIRKVDDDLFERMALCGIPAQEWNVAPVTENVNYVLLA